MNIDDSVDWDSDRNVGAEVNRVNNVGIEGHVGAEVVINDGEVIEI